MSDKYQRLWTKYRKQTLRFRALQNLVKVPKSNDLPRQDLDDVPPAEKDVSRPQTRLKKSSKSLLHPKSTTPIRFCPERTKSRLHKKKTRSTHSPSPLQERPKSWNSLPSEGEEDAIEPTERTFFDDDSIADTENILASLSFQDSDSTLHPSSCYTHTHRL